MASDPWGRNVADAAYVGLDGTSPVTCGSTPVPVPPRLVVLRPQDVLRVFALLVPFGRSAPSVGGSVLSMNPFSLEGTTMVPTTFIRIRSLFRPRRVGINSHPDAVSEASLNLPRRIDDPTSAAQLTRDLLRNHREDITMALYLDDRHRLVGTAILTIGWVQAARLSARPILFGTQACQSSTCILVRYRRYGASSATEGEERSFRTIAAACSRYGVVVADHVIVVG